MEYNEMKNGYSNGIWKKALKSAIYSLSSSILVLGIADPEHFNVYTYGGWKHLTFVIIFKLVLDEAKFWKNWASNGNGVK